MDESEKRKQIHDINNDKTLSQREKNKRIFHLLNPKDDTSDSSSESESILCEHYQRLCDIQCPSCKKWYPCRLCHNEFESHELDRYKVSQVRCRSCYVTQPPNQICISCNEVFGEYYCDYCHLWGDQMDAFHCDECKMCRIGNSVDYKHCNICGICMLVDHVCHNGWVSGNCAICLENLFTSVIQPIRLNCGHGIHNKCLLSYCQSDYRCPICHKSVDDMTISWQLLDSLLENERLQDPYDKWQSEIQCLDCLTKATVAFHYQYHKCPECGSYNTQKLKTIQSESSES